MEENGVVVPQEVKGWNWGAFMFNIYWGIGNKSYLPLLTLIPIFNIIWIFVVGFKGNAWAWQKGGYKDVATFKAVQATWNRAGLVAFILTIIVVIAYFLMFATLINAVISDATY
ncbi:hypothetical protein FC70_GL000726 [Paucilactobacillus oligofermentans DSM 15707 = LMG 22743]|uniref:Uncharacterized protein n=1 Tax=Paucilactobacillus oligofermentans DSM 15707 = LMG 22743 TaxID=1423778 RepID=A0A0R1RK18_9LACO|nr:hypothetical protein [Paucilactobacillus oligofermentans]KRL55130.1 hypothetical protein FC70_GL000726 [Paucilactobacillus oligofermentans DSM 15707 = LMG 22743]CUS25882.1 Uncharacterized protein LACOL_0574 [Paucilactobacillus oligofermentans DSM 15707 = LMG 22743]